MLIAAQKYFLKCHFTMPRMDGECHLSVRDVNWPSVNIELFTHFKFRLSVLPGVAAEICNSGLENLGVWQFLFPQ